MYFHHCAIDYRCPWAASPSSATRKKCTSGTGVMAVEHINISYNLDTENRGTSI